MGFFAKKKPKTSFRSSVEKAAEAIRRMEVNAVSNDELKAVADAWLALVSELNPAMSEKPEKKEEK